MTVTRRLAAILAADCDEISESLWHFSEVVPLAFGGRSRFKSGL